MDQWLWAVRVFKTRSNATDGIKAGHVTVNGQGSKPAREVRVGDLIVARVGEVTRTVKVIEMPRSRVGAKLVGKFAEDLTPTEEYERRREPNYLPPMLRARGSGRPTKRDRRALDEFGSGE